MQSVSDFDWFYGDVNGALSSGIRGVVTARGTKKLLIADYAQMEARMLAFLAKDEKKLQAFRDGVDIYLEPAVYIYGREITKEDKQERHVCKTFCLACQYESGIAGTEGMIDSYGIDVSEVVPTILESATVKEREKAEWSYYERYLPRRKQSQKSSGKNKDKEPVEPIVGFAFDIVKQRWRAANPEIVRYWRNIESAAVHAAKNRRVVEFNSITWFTNSEFLHCRLPSGRILTYPFFRVSEENKLSYMGKHPVTGKWVRLSTYGGKLTENIVQAAQRDLLSEAMIRLEDCYPVLFHVHDELIFELPFDADEEEAEAIREIMCKGRKWTEGLPVDVDLFYAERYRK